MIQEADSSFRHEDISKKDAVNLIYNIIKKEKRALTKADFQEKTGLSLFKVEDALNELMNEYPCVLEVDKQGRLIYIFNIRQTRNELLSKKGIAKLADNIKFFLIFLFKMMITVVFFSYALTFGAAIAVLISALAKSPQPIVVLFLSLFYAIKMLFVDVQVFFSIRKQKEIKAEESLIAMVFNYAFGNLDKNGDKLQEEKKIIAYLKQNDSKITATDVMLATGWSYQKCSEELTYMLTHYRGKVYVSDDGIIIYEFPEFEKNTDYEKSSNSKFFIWNNLISFVNWNKNKPLTNKIIGGIAWFSLIVSVLVTYFSVNEYSASEFFLKEIISFSAGWFSYTFYLIGFFLFFIISSWFARIKADGVNSEIRSKNKYYKSLQVIFSHLPTIAMDKLAFLSQKSQRTIVYNCKGETFVDDEDASVNYSFTLLKQELDSVLKERNIKLPYYFATPKEIIQRKGEKEKSTKKTKKKSGCAKYLIPIFAMVIFVFIFWTDINAIIKTQTTSHNTYDRLKVNHNSLFMKLVKTESYKFFREIEIHNATAEYPVPDLSESTNIETLRIINSHESPKLPDKSESIEYLTLKNCRLDSFPKEIFKYRNLRKLNVNHNSIHEIPKKISLLTRLFSIEASHNKISEFPSFLLDNEKISDINLDYNKIEEFPKSVKNYMYTISLEGNAIKTLPDNFWEFKVGEINVSYNSLSEIPEVEIDTSKIIDFKAKGNNLQEFPKGLSRIRNFRNLDLRENNIKEIPAEVGEITMIYDLMLGSNQISKLPNEITRLKFLRNLSIEYNPITEVPKSMNRLKNAYNCTIHLDRSMPENVKQRFLDIVGLKKVKFVDTKSKTKIEM